MDKIRQSNRKLMIVRDGTRKSFIHAPERRKPLGAGDQFVAEHFVRKQDSSQAAGTWEYRVRQSSACSFTPHNVVNGSLEVRGDSPMG